MRRLAMLLLLLLPACGGPGPGWREVRPEPLPLDAPLKNPERGFYATGLDPFHPDDAALAEIAENFTLVYPYAGWLPRDRALSKEELAHLETTFRLVKKHGLKLILRFRYGEDGDADLDLIQEHVRQLLPIVRENADLVYVFQAGFLGRWGEWHCWQASATCHDDAETKAWLLDELLAGLPPELPIALRYPADKLRYLGLDISQPPARPLEGKTARRLVHHNDCYLAGPTDTGTYPEEDPEAWRAFVYAENDRLPYGGETCEENPPRTDGENALKESARAHLDYLNSEYHDGLIRAWKQDGTYAALAAWLGYRIGLVRARWPEAVPAGGRFTLEITLQNTGFARLKRARPGFLFFASGDGRQAMPLPLDLTQLGPGETRTWRLRLVAPDLKGPVQIGLWFPDPSPRLRDDPRYAIRLASALPFENGVNRLGTLRLR